jgi:ribosomal protein L7Ae-like RNA K-turn-binding protein
MIVVTAVTLAIAIFNFQQPHEAEKKKIEDQYKSLIRKEKNARQIKTQINKAYEEIESIKKDIVTLLKERTKGRDLTQFITDLERDAQDSGVSLKSVRIQAQTQRQKFTEIPLEFQIDGAYFQIYDFLSRIEKRGLVNFTHSGMALSGGGAARGVTVKNLKDMIDSNPKVQDRNGSNLKIKPYTSDTQFPKMRVQFDGSIIIIDKSHIAAYE